MQKSRREKKIQFKKSLKPEKQKSGRKKSRRRKKSKHFQLKCRIVKKYRRHKLDKNTRRRKKLKKLKSEKAGEIGCKKKTVRCGRFHVEGPRKKVNVEKWIFFDEM